MISTRTMATAALAIAAATGCTAAHGHQAASGPSDTAASPTGTAPSPIGSARPPSPATTTTTTNPTPTDPTATPASPTPMPTPDPSPTVGARASDSDLCTNGYVYIWGFVTDAQDDVKSVVLNMHFASTSGSRTSDSQPTMVKDSAHADQYDFTVRGGDFLGQTGTLHYSVTATDNAGHSTTTASYTLPVDTC